MFKRYTGAQHDAPVPDIMFTHQVKGTPARMCRDWSYVGRNCRHGLLGATCYFHHVQKKRDIKRNELDKLKSFERATAGVTMVAGAMFCQTTST
jgi:hypothetical protein